MRLTGAGTDGVVGYVDPLVQRMQALTFLPVGDGRVDSLLLSAGMTTPDATKRAEIYLDIQKILANDMPVVNLFELEFLVVYNTKLKGAYDSAMGAYASFGDAYLD